MAGPSGAASTGAGQPVSAPRPFHERDPWGEKVHTYVRAQGFGAASDPAPGRWSRRQHWTVAELGTGTGCALACLLAAFERHAAPTQTLHYVGFERDPTMLDWWRDPASRARIPSPERAALEAILAADQVVLGPGSLYTSVLAATAVPGIAEGLAATSAHLVYVCNLRPQASETAGYGVAEHLEALDRHGIRPSVVVYDPATIGEPDRPVDVELCPAVLCEPGGGAHRPDRLGPVLAGLAGAADWRAP